MSDSTDKLREYIKFREKRGERFITTDHAALYLELTNAQAYNHLTRLENEGVVTEHEPNSWKVKHE